MAKSSKKAHLDIRIRILVSLLMAVLVFLLTFFKTFNVLDTQLSDSFYQTESVSILPITIVKIDEKTLNAIGQPSEWSRQVYADLLDKLNATDKRPSVVAFDLLFTGYKDEAGDRAFAEAASKYGNVVSGLNAFSKEGSIGKNALTIDNLVHVEFITFPYKELNDVSFSGLVNCSPDRYDYITTAYTGMWYDDTWYDSFSICTLKRFLRYVKDHPDYAAMHPDYADIEIPDYSADPVNRYRFSYAEGPGGFDSVSMIDILNGDFPASSLENNIVLVGIYASGLQDDFKILLSNDSQTSRMYGVEIHANIMEAVFENKFQTDADSTLLAFIYAGISGLLAFVLLGTSIIAGVLLALGTAAVHVMISLILYRNGIYVMLLHMLVACGILILGLLIFHYVFARLERAKINHAFRMYVAPEIVDEVAQSGSYELALGGRSKDIAVLFVDIRGFTTMSENLPPEEVVAILNEYFQVITDAIFKNKGTLDKFIGDAAMAVFNSPFDLDDYVYRAVSTACDIAEASEKLGEKLMERFGKKVSYGIGVNCGEAIIGNIGSPFRMDYTAIGDTVNTAARLESNAKAGEILISEEVKKRLDSRIETEDIGEIPLKGKHNKIFVYRVTRKQDGESKNDT